MSTDDTLGSAILLVAGGAAGYAAAHYLIAPSLAASAAVPSAMMTPTPASPALPSSTIKTTTTTPASSPAVGASAASAATAGMLRPRRSASGTPGSAMPIDPYATDYAPPHVTPTTPIASQPSRDPDLDPYAGPSGSMRPVDPYASSPPSSGSHIVSSIVTTTTPVSPLPTTPLATNAPIATTVRAPTAPGGAITLPSQSAEVLSPPASTQSTPSSSRTPAMSGPITRPSQVDSSLSGRPIEHAPGRAPSPSTPARSAFATSPRVRRFDPVFDRYRGSLPIEYVRALVERESLGDPKVRTGQAIGLMQIVPVVLADYNKRHGTKYGSVDLAQPATNVAIGCELLHLIVQSYRRHHPRITTLQGDWDNPAYVALLTFGWNAGFSEAGGVGRVARYLEQLGAIDITIDQVAAHAKLAGASRHLSNPAKLTWCKSVVALYERESALGRALVVA